ncbi:MAG: Rieske (2Fe-2S) protein [Chloroflexi bacterium]|nr:Rieske (2Fe-2S) protein [Chloroflexota bacterium]MBU1751347.1 Rieske (2Fe-2S) protein [Chloroflexota bacterium]
MDWIKVLDQDELAEGDKHVVEVAGREVVLIRDGDQLYAVNRKCPHMGAHLDKGEVKDGVIVCPRHHSAFDLRTGDVMDWTPWPPGVGRVLGAVSREKALAVYPTRVEDGAIWVGIEQA